MLVSLTVLVATLVFGAAASAQTAGDRITVTIPGTDVVFGLVYVPAGTFALGSPETEAGREADEGPRRRVAMEGFWIGAHEVTHDEFNVFRYARLDSESTAVAGVRLDVDAVSRPSPPYEDPAHGMDKANHPATGMTQWAALRYARWLSEKTGDLYRIPTEAEWEYACRAGTTTAYPFGDETGPLADHAWHAENSGDRYHRVGSKTPNGWGIYDMLGNVAEWTMDQYDASFYASLEGDPVRAPWARPDRDHPRTVRGGAFDDQPASLRCADRSASTLRWKRRDPQLPKSRWWNTDSPHVGFRLVRDPRSLTPDAIRAYWADLLGTP